MYETSVIPRHGGYKNLKTFQLAQLIYDVTVRFCDLYIDRRSRTHDQMVQAARSGSQNIAEGSMASATSKKTEMKLTSVAKASLEELRLDYRSFLRHRALPEWPPNHPSLKRFKAQRCSKLEDVQAWVKSERALTTPLPGGHGRGTSVSSAHLVANAALSLLNLCCPMVGRQLSALAKTFEREGGFSERLYRVRSHARGRNWPRRTRTD